MTGNSMQSSTTMNQLIPSELWASLESDDHSTVMNTVRASHAPDGRKVDVKPMLRIIDNILLRAAPAIVQGTYEDKVTVLEEDKISLPDADAKLKTLAPIIKKVSSELFSYNNLFLSGTFKSNSKINQTIISPYGVKMDCKCTCSGGRDVHATIMGLLDTLSSYSWDAKVVLTVAAFIVNYGHEIFLFSSSYSNNSSALAQSMALLKQLRDITEHAKLSKPKIDAIMELIKVIMGVTRYIVELHDLPPESIETDETPMSNAMAYIPKAAYWTILSAVVCASYIASLSSSEESISTELLDLTRLAREGSKILVILKKHLTICKEYVDEKCKTAYWDLVQILNTPNLDNITILKTLFFVKDGKRNLVDRTGRRVHIEDLREKNVLLLISGLDHLSKEEIDTLGKLYQEAQTKKDIQYQVVWIPVVEKTISWDQEKQQKYEQLLSLMPWYAVPEPSRTKAEVIKYIKKVWHFENKMVAVPLDGRGKIRSLNALDMLLIWGNKAVSSIFTTDQIEESIWEAKHTCTLDLLLGGIDNNFSLVLDWTKQGTIVCLYGGEDIEWIREFTKATKDVVKSINSGISFELVYVGKSNAIKEVEKINNIIDAENLSRYWSDLTSVWFFWTRLESILYLKMQQGKNFKNDSIMQQVTTLLSYDGSDKGWALFCRGPSDEMAMAKGEVALKIMKEFSDWKDAAIQNGFFQALSTCFQKSQKIQRCNRVILAGNRWEIPSKKLSSEGCECSMEKCFMYRCCAD